MMLPVLGLLLALQGCDCGSEEARPVRTIQFESPQDGAVLGASQDQDPATLGLQLDVVVRTEAINPGVVLSLTVAEEAPLTAAVEEDRRATFRSVTLPTGQAVRLTATGPGNARATITVTVQSTGAMLRFVTPQTGDELGPAQDVAPAEPGLQYDVIVTGSQVPAGTSVELRYDNTRPPRNQLMQDSQVTFAAVTLPPGETVTLTARAVVNQQPLETEVTISVAEEPEPPELNFVRPLQAERITRAQDVDDEQAGIQYDVLLQATAVAEGERVQLVIEDAEALEAELDRDGRARFPAVTLPAGDAIELTAALDLDGSTVRAAVTVAVEGTAEEPEITWVEPVFGQRYTAADDLDGDLLNGLQADLTLETLHVENNREVTLVIGEVTYPRRAPVTNGTVLFEGVTLPEAPEVMGGLELLATVQNEAGLEATDSVRILVETGSCVVHLEPLPLAERCDFIEDPLPATPEVEAIFTVRTQCGQVRLLHNQQLFAEQALPAGQTELRFTGVPLVQGLNLLQAEATEPDGRHGLSQEQRYQVDTVPPALGLAELAELDRPPTVLARGDDLDPAQPGLQLQLAGWALGLPTGAQPRLTVRGPGGEELPEAPTVTVLAATDEIGRHLLALDRLTLPDSGLYQLELTGTDGCGLTGGSPVYQLEVALEQPELRIATPLDQAILLANDDAAPDLEGYQTLFTVLAQGVPAGDEVEVRCGLRDRPNRNRVGIGQMPAGEGEQPLAIMATLPDGQLTCHAAYQGVNPAISEEISVLVAGEWPVITFLQPRQTRVNIATVTVVVRTVNVEDNQEVNLLVNGVRLPQAVAVRQGGATLEAVPLQPGRNTLIASVSDRAGNLAEASLELLYDHEPPVVLFRWPTDGAVLTAADDLDGDPQNGFQLRPLVQIDGVDPQEGATACLALGGLLQDPCPDAPLPVQGGELSFAPLRLVSGENVLIAEVLDGAGNRGVGLAAVRVELDAPTVTLVPPPAGTCLSSGADVRLELRTDAGDGARALLTINGRAEPEVPVQGGLAVFSVQLPENRLSTVVAEVREEGRTPGFSPPLQLTVRTHGGTLAFLAPTDGAVLNLATASVTSPGLALDVRLIATDLDLDRSVTLMVDCGEGTQEYAAPVTPAADGQRSVTFRAVSLPDEAHCLLRASSINCAGFMAQATAALRVDRLAPTVNFLFPTDGTVLTFQNDVDREAAGLQIHVRVQVNGAEPGTLATLQVGDREPHQAEVVDGSVTFLNITIPEGRELRCRVSLADAAGNPAVAEVRLAEVVANEPTLAFFTPARDTTWNSNNDLDRQLPEFQQDFIFVTSNLGDGTEVRLCGNRHAGDGIFCGQPGYQVLGTGRITNNRVTVRGTLLQGSQDVYGEARYAVNRRAESRTLRLEIDTTRPTVANFAVVSDQEPLGILNRAEDLRAGGPTLEARVEVVFADDPADEFDGLRDGRAVTLLTDNPAPGTVVGAVPAQASQASFPLVSLAPGRHQLSLRALDLAGNGLPDATPTITLLVDIDPPTLSFVRPIDGAVLNMLDDLDPVLPGLQLDVVLTASGADPNQQVLLSVAGVPAPPLAYAAGQLIFADVTLPDGTIPLEALLRDAAGNEARVAIQVVSDPVPPTIAILSPAAGTEFQGPDDLDPGRGGFQIDVLLQVEGAVGMPVEVRSQGSVVSDPARLDEQGRAVVRCTLPPAAQTLVAQVTDEHGNPAVSTPVPINVEIVGCGIYFVQPASSPAVLGRQADLDQDASNGLQTEIRIAVANLGCDGRPLELLRNGQVWTSTVITNGLANFPSLTFDDGSEVTLQGRASDGQTESFTSLLVVRTDLVPPAGRLIRPGTAPATLLAMDDLDPWEAGLQFRFRLELTDMAGGTLILGSDVQGELVRLPNAATPQPLVSGLLDLPVVTLEQGRHLLRVELIDAADNSYSFEIEITVDHLLPGTPEVTATLVDRRLPAIRLAWTALGDDDAGGSVVTGYEVRYATRPITDQSWATACVHTWEAPIVPPGEQQEVVLEGPGPDGACRLRLDGTTVNGVFQGGAYHFAVRAIDGQGQRSELATVGPVEITLRVTAISVNSSKFGKVVTPVGDVNGDGFPDLGVAASEDNRAWVVFGRAELDDWTVQEIPAPALNPAVASFGYAMAGVGDVDGDQLADFVVGGRGAVWLYRGGRGLLSTIPAAQFNVSATGFPNVAGAGDFDGTAPRDIVVGDFLFNSGKGAAWIILGRPAEQWPGLAAPLALGLNRAANDASGVIAFEGTAASMVGDQVAGLGNFCLPEDRRDDLVLSGFRYNANVGQAYILCGRTLADLPPGQNLTVADARVIPSPTPAQAGNFGYFLLGGVDLVDDDHPDLAITAWKTKTVHVYPGGVAGVPEVRASFKSGVTDFGRFLAALDLDGNGYGDLLIATRGVEEPNGLATFFLGQPQGFSPPAPNGFHYGDPEYRGALNSEFGRSVAAPGDMNQDGAPEFAIGSPGTQQVFLYH